MNTNTHYKSDPQEFPRWSIEKEGQSFRANIFKWTFPGGENPPQCELLDSQICRDLEMAQVFIRFNIHKTK